MDLHKIWIEQCEAAQGIEEEFGTDKALAYLVGEKFINFLEAAEDIFERWQLTDLRPPLWLAYRLARVQPICKNLRAMSAPGKSFALK